MSWPIRMVQRLSDGPPPAVGDMFYAPWLLPESDFWLSRQYDETWRGKRHPLVVRLPGCVDFCVDGCYRSRQVPNPMRNGWVVTGVAPLITVATSINCVGIYHGWIRNGVISDDCEGRIYTPDGMQQLRPSGAAS